MITIAVTLLLLVFCGCAQDAEQGETVHDDVPRPPVVRAVDDAPNERNQPILDALARVELGSAVALELGDGTKTLGMLFSVDGDSITIEVATVLRTVRTHTIERILIPVDSSRGFGMEEIYP